jgi:hypothetical protein
MLTTLSMRHVAPEREEENMSSIEIRCAMQGKEVSVDSFIENIEFCERDGHFTWYPEN